MSKKLVKITDAAAEHFDATETLFLREQLTQIRRQAIEHQFPEKKARRLIPLKRDTNPGAEYVEFQVLKRIGNAKIITNYASDLPTVNLVGSSHIGRVKSLGDSFCYSVQEVRNAAMAGQSLNARFATAAKEAILDLENKIAWEGDSSHNLFGMFNNPNIPRAIAPTGSSGFDWSVKTAAEIVEDMNQCVNGVSENSEGVFQANLLVLPLSKYNLIASTQFSTASDVTILQWFLRNNPYIDRVEWLNELEDASTTGDAMMMAYKLDPNILELDVPQDFEIFPEQMEGMTMKWPCHSRMAGVHIYQPLAVNFLEDF